MDWTRCPRTHHAVHEALALARALSQKISKEEEEEEEEKSERERETKDVVVKECTKRLRLLSTQLRRLELPSFAEPEVTLAKRESERSGRKGDSKNNLDDLRNFSRSLLDSSSSLLGERERERAEHEGFGFGFSFVDVDDDRDPELQAKRWKAGKGEGGSAASAAARGLERRDSRDGQGPEAEYCQVQGQAGGKRQGP